MEASLPCSHISRRAICVCVAARLSGSVEPRTLFLEQGLPQPDTIRITITREMEPSIEIADRWHTRTQ
jgi:hypothetical protein